MFDVTAIGELLIDFTPAGKDQNGSAMFTQNPGGAPANVLVANSRLGGNTALIGKVGDDAFGSFLEDTLIDAGVNTDSLVKTDQFHTTLAFVQLNAHGDRSFSFYRNPGADIMLTRDDVDDSLLKNTHVLHFGSVSLTDEPSRSATLYAVKTAKRFGAMISYDPNYRAPLWQSEKEAVQQIKSAMPLADIVKLSEEELVLLTGERELLKGTRAIQQAGATLVLVTLGIRGAFYLLGDLNGILPTYDTDTIDTNGAGDAFTGAILFCLKDKTIEEIRNMGKNEIEPMVDFANAAGALATTRHGAIPAMPTLQQVSASRAEVPYLPVE